MKNNEITNHGINKTVSDVNEDERTNIRILVNNYL